MSYVEISICIGFFFFLNKILCKIYNELNIKYASMLVNILDYNKKTIKKIIYVYSYTFEVFNLLINGKITFLGVYNYFLLRCRLFFTSLFESGHVENCGRYNKITYFIRDTKYVIITKIKRGIRDVSYVYDGNFKDGDIEYDQSKDITEKISMYMGPYKDFHKIPTTPSMLGYTHLTVKYKNGIIRNFSHNEVIIVSCRDL